MIKISKSTAIPTILTIQGTADRQRLCNQYNANPPVYHIPYNKITNPHKLEVDTSIYGDKTVKQQIITDQHKKCCFCEATFLANGYGDVEHYRPKGGYKQNAGDSLGKPGYYWLAYEWSNLLFSCDVCNRSFKKNFFPLSTTYRALNHHNALENSANCLLINPINENPELHITFNQEIPVGKTNKGKESINKYGIGRATLNEERRKHLREVKANLMLSEIDIANLTDNQKNQIKSWIGAQSDADLQAVVDDAINFRNNCAKVYFPFTNLVRSNFPNLPKI